MVLAGVTDARVVLSAPEVPLLDGCARRWHDLLTGAGLADLPGKAATVGPTEPVFVHEGNAWVGWLPGPGLRVAALYHHPDPRLPVGWAEADAADRDGAASLLDARTFLLPEESDALLADGVLAARAEEAVGAAAVPGREPFRDPGEPARHKALDLVGDAALAGAVPRGTLVSVRGGHRLNRRLVSAVAGVPERSRHP